MIRTRIQFNPALQRWRVQARGWFLWHTLGYCGWDGDGYCFEEQLHRTPQEAQAAERAYIRRFKLPNQWLDA